MVAFLTIGFLETAIFSVITEGLGLPAVYVVGTAVAQGLFAIAAGLAAGRIIDRLGSGRTAALGLGIFGCFAATMIVPSIPVVFVAAGLQSVGMTFYFVSFNTALQELAPADMRGRVFGSASAGIALAQVVSIAGGALIGLFLPYPILLILVTGGCILGAVIMLRAGRPLTPPNTILPTDEASKHRER